MGSTLKRAMLKGCGYMECRNCTERFIGCHSTCESYLEYRKAQDEILRNRYIQGTAKREKKKYVRHENVLTTHKYR